MRILAVDPGINGAGVAIFSGALLERAQYVRMADNIRKADILERARTLAGVVREVAGFIELLVLEWPQVYTTGKIDRNDLLGLAAVDGAITALFGCPVKTVKPHEWKGGIDGDVMVERIKSRLSGEERSRVVLAGCLSHNIYDAIGVGLHHLRRLERQRNFAR